MSVDSYPSSKSLAAAKHLNNTINLLISHYFRTKLEENKSFAVGHLALGYVFSKLTAKATKTKLNIPLIFTLSIIPDIDILIPFLEHRGPTHSIITATVIFIPLFILWRKNALPYFIAYIQHPLVGDFITGGSTQLLWPLTLQPYGLETGIKSLINISLEWIASIASATILIKTKEIKTFLQPHNSNLILFIPLSTVLLPIFLAFPLDVPSALIPPHLLFLALFSMSILMDIKQICQTTLRKTRSATTKPKIKILHCEEER